MINSNTILVFFFWAFLSSAICQTNQLSFDTISTAQSIDGFGAHQSGSQLNQLWWNDLFFEDMDCSIFRVDLTPVLRNPYSDLSYYSPWFMGSQVRSVFNLEDPSNPNGPENNRVRTYTGPNDYSRTFGGRNAPIAIMGPDINLNMNYFNYQNSDALRRISKDQSEMKNRLLIGSIWSPVPWVKKSSGNRYPQNWWPGPVINTAWPFVWGGNFAGGQLDVSNLPLEVFNDRALGGSGPTSSITQFARSTSAYIAGYQKFHNVKFYAISIQNELNFEQFYNSATYPLSGQYILALKALRNEFNKYTELKDIKIMGPEDLMGGDAYGMWEYGGPIHKNLQYLTNIENDPEASKALDFFCIHGYASDGVSSSGADPRQWKWWTSGWNQSPAQGIPANVKGFTFYQKKSWMTETSGEHPDWIYPKTAFPGQGGFGLAIKIHQALTIGRQSAWIYWTFSDSDNNGNVSDQGLTNQSLGASSPKYVAAKHYFKWIRPGARLVQSNFVGTTSIYTSVYYHSLDKTFTLVLLNASDQVQNIMISWPHSVRKLQAFTSYENNYWKSIQPNSNKLSSNLQLNPYSATTIIAESDFTSVVDKETTSEFLKVISVDVQSDCVKVYSRSPITVYLSIHDLSGKNIITSEKIRLVEGINQVPFNNNLNQNQLYFGSLRHSNEITNFHIIKR